jgi:YVTN family beta-propeller protein
MTGIRKALCVTALLFAFLGMTEAEGDYHFIKAIPIGGEGGWDCLTADGVGRRLYVTHANKIVVVDLESGKIAGEIGETPGVHGLAIVPDSNRGFSSNGAESRVSVIDLKTLKTLEKVETGENPDVILYEPTRAEIYVFNGRGKSATVLDAKSGQVTATIPLSGKPEFAAADADNQRVFCNIEDKNEVAVIDTKTHTVTATWPLAPNEEPSGMAFDPVHRRLFVGCHNKVMAMLDSDTGKILATAPIGAGVDGCAFDEATQLAFASCGDGTLTIAKEETPEKLSLVQTITTERGARTMALDPKTHRVYTATAQIVAEQSSPSPGERRRPNYVPGTFHLLVYGRE